MRSLSGGRCFLRAFFREVVGVAAVGSSGVTRAVTGAVTAVSGVIASDAVTSVTAGGEIWS